MPYRYAGYEVINVTLPEYDVREFPLPEFPVHGILAAPPCTEFAVSGARWWKDKDPALLEEALDIVDACLVLIEWCHPTWWALENPAGRLRQLRPNLGEPALSFNPCDYGDPWTKRTLVWGNFNPPPKRWVRTEGKNPVHWAPGKGAKRAGVRSQTPEGFAFAFFDANP